MRHFTTLDKVAAVMTENQNWIIVLPVEGEPFRLPRDEETRLQSILECDLLTAGSPGLTKIHPLATQESVRWRAVALLFELASEGGAYFDFLMDDMGRYTKTPNMLVLHHTRRGPEPYFGNLVITEIESTGGANMRFDVVLKLLTDVLPLKNEIYEDSDTEESESESDFLHALWKAKENVLKNQDASFREVPLSSNVERSS